MLCVYARRKSLCAMLCVYMYRDNGEGHKHLVGCGTCVDTKMGMFGSALIFTEPKNIA